MIFVFGTLFKRIEVGSFSPDSSGYVAWSVGIWSV